MMSHQQDASHITISLLWEYSRKVSETPDEHQNHLGECQDCLAVLWISRTCASVEHLKFRLEAIAAQVVVD
jgi:hypothetical protein